MNYEGTKGQTQYKSSTLYVILNTTESSQYEKHLSSLQVQEYSMNFI